ncbi:M23 family metallopeptidase [Blastococcus sp. LR1]|uniref:M23 family metallopeptidase n=1 Tax=Blastococcus sp. LR1 TaxID=2877000 RepID=UPI001CCBD32D|nr:M23 family metallopeptidase [Blastococcus sp. LR1]MCA0143820.1 M23 family metallopeptidase [Blastococcus sp. LR1]
MLAGVLLVASGAPVLAAPAPPNPTDGQIGAAQSEQDAAAAEVGRIAGQVAVAEAELERVGIQAEAAGTAYLLAEDALLQAQAVAEQAAAELQAAATAVSNAEARIGRFSRDSYMKGSTLAATAALLDAEGPGELIQRAALLDYVGANEVDVLGELQVAKVAHANADSSARAARDEMAAAEGAAQAAKADADARLATQQSAYAEVAGQKARYEAELQAAQIRLLEVQGARDAHQQWVAQKQAEEAAAAAAAERSAREAAEAAAAARNNGPHDGGGSGASSGYVKPFSGRVTSCFGARWGTNHNGLDVASSIGTPLYAPVSGTVKRAGSATGFGLAVYLLGDDGAVYVYGHINDYFVRTGDRVVAGEQVAEVGNRGQSTGPHVHFEVHPNGAMYSGASDPVGWLNARGIRVGACGG